ncbi:MAG: transcription-repair coupling factor [Oligoflexales bacterium]|nr:transcription-repair coupling factor [Oligoflexales bacterium]
MGNYIGLKGLQEGILNSFKHGQKAQVITGSEAANQLSITSLLAHLSTQYQHDSKNCAVIILPNTKDMGHWFELLNANLGELPGTKVHQFVPYSMWGNDRFINHSVLIKRRLAALADLVEGEHFCVIVTSLQAMAQRTISLEAFKEQKLPFKTDEEYDLEDTLSLLETIGYQKVHRIEEAGYYALRGGVLDVFPINLPKPIRLEFLGDNLLSIREFSLENQRSEQSVDAVVVYPCQEALLFPDKVKSYAQALHEELLAQKCKPADRTGMVETLSKGLRFNLFELFAPLFRLGEASIFDYLEPDSCLIFPNNFQSCLDSYEESLESLVAGYEQDISAQRATLSPEKHFLGGALPDAVKSLQALWLEFSKLTPEQGFEEHALQASSLSLPPLLPNTPKYERWLPVWKDLAEQGGQVIVLGEGAHDASIFEDLLTRHDMGKPEKSSLPSLLNKGEHGPSLVKESRGHISSWFWDEESLVLFIPRQELFAAAKKKRRAASKELQQYLSSFKDLKVGDLVVHAQHGIASYQGMRQIQVGGASNDFLDLEYHGGDKVYLPVDRISLLQRYYGSEQGKKAALDRLGGGAWAKRKSKVSQAIKDIAEDLLRIQAQRALKKGFRYDRANELFEKFIDDFPYDETEDQIKAWDDIDADLSSSKAMDRVIVGDVGFGKTEIAMRAAMRAVLAGFQVLVLVPTTVLCYQHAQTFKERLSKYGVEVASINRFLKASQQKEVLQRLSKGTCDVLVGTHRILSKDCRAKNLGLVIIDEEHRFGVSHKEALKELKSNADILVLTATPIPRTLHMAMIGIRDISMIATPPHDRLPVKTLVSKFDDQLIEDAITYELSRGGQVFFLQNRVEGIEETVSFLKKLVPRARVDFAHGQMNQVQLENRLLSFLEQKLDVLVCTTIIESGIDMPNVNTMIVNRSESFGLAQLYQLRGRVGRSSVQAYAYFLVNSQTGSKDGLKRLEVLQAHQELGAGFHIASYDLELRGAGNLVGGEQSGHVNSIGLEMYTEMLNRCIEKLAGKETMDVVDPELKLSSGAHIPAEYMELETDRLSTYKQIFSCDQEEDIYELANSVKDRYGPLPTALSELFVIASIKIYLKKMRASRLIEQGKGLWLISFSQLTEAHIAGLLTQVGKNQKTLSLSSDFTLKVKLVKNEEALGLGGFLEWLKGFKTQLDLNSV